MSALWPNGQKISMEDFLSDKRLYRWFTQNYDLIGCNMYTCSPYKISDMNSTSDSNYTISPEVMAKVIPIPIGLDLHSKAKHKDKTRSEQLVCDQLNQLYELKKGINMYEYILVWKSLHAYIYIYIYVYIYTRIFSCSRMLMIICLFI
jgi:cytochrome oxidase assembly protein ShyY1